MTEKRDYHFKSTGLGRDGEPAIKMTGTSGTPEVWGRIRIYQKRHSVWSWGSHIFSIGVTIGSAFMTWWIAIPIGIVAYILSFIVPAWFLGRTEQGQSPTPQKDESKQP
tara:strand:- start:502 stop:828 length:327 start_codon:yes stop_codon:yes gene_type:complete